MSSPSQKPTSYRLRLAEHAEVVVWFATERGKVVSYSVVLLALDDGRWQTIRVYDNAHGQNEMHRHSASGGKQPAEAFSEASDFGEAMRAAREAVLAGPSRTAVALPDRSAHTEIFHAVSPGLH